MTAENIIAILSLLGLGGLLSSYLTLLWQRRNADLAKKQDYKETRYKCIIMLMQGVFDFDRSKKEFQKYGYQIHNLDDLLALLRAEHINAFLFASDDFLTAFAQFIQEQNQTNLHRTALAIRQDLWGVKTSLSMKHFQKLPDQASEVTARKLAEPQGLVRLQEKTYGT